jgi:hypothetical protein
MTVFAPFPMALLLLFKLLVPFVALAGVSSVINKHLRLPPLSLFLVGSVLSELLTIYVRLFPGLPSFFSRVKLTKIRQPHTVLLPSH